jgi:hypothetical protein
MVSLPTRGASLRLTASSATSRTVHRVRPVGGSLHTMAMMRCFWLSSSKLAAPGPLLLIERPFQSPFLVAVTDFPNRLGSQRDNVGKAWGADALSELQECRGAQHDAHRLHAAAQQCAYVLLVLCGDMNTQG